MKVNNINGTSGRICRCGSWLKHWQNFTSHLQKSRTSCPVNDCPEKIAVGAHVQKDNAADSNWYIIPLCNKHNAETRKSLNIDDNITLVSANIAQTCDKQGGFQSLLRRGT